MLALSLSRCLAVVLGSGILTSKLSLGKRAVSGVTSPATSTYSWSTSSGFSSTTTTGAAATTTTTAAAMLGAGPANIRSCSPDTVLEDPRSGFRLQLLDDPQSGVDGWTNGYQCMISDYWDTNAISWSTEFTWTQEPDRLKASPEAIMEISGIELARIAAIHTKWDWGVNGSNIKAAAAFNLTFQDPVAITTGMTSYQIRIWIARFGDVAEAPVPHAVKVGTVPLGQKYTFSKWQVNEITAGPVVWWFVQEGAPDHPISGASMSWEEDLLPLVLSIKGELFPRSQRLMEVSAGGLIWAGEKADFWTGVFILSVDS